MKPPSLKETLDRFDSEKLEFEFKTLEGKVRSRAASTDEYTYFVISSLQSVIQRDIRLLDRATEQSGTINEVRRSFFKVNENCGTRFMPKLF